MFCSSDTCDSAICLSEGSHLDRFAHGSILLRVQSFPSIPPEDPWNSNCGNYFAAGDVIVYAAS